MDAVRGARIDEHRAAVVSMDQRRGLDGRRIWEAQDDSISSIDGISTSVGVLALVVWERDELDVTPRRQPVAHLQARCPGLALCTRVHA